MEQLKYNDRRLFLWLIPLINIINYYLTYNSFTHIGILLATFTIDTLEGYIAWFFVRSIIIWLDGKISFEENTVKRIVVQIALTLLAGITTIIILTEITNWLASSNPVPSSFYKKDIPIISIWFFAVNGIYIGMHYYYKWQQSENKLKEDRKIILNGFKVSTPKKEQIYPFHQIIGFYIDGDYSIMVTTDKKKQFLDFSLDKVEKNLPINLFFRLNRQYIIHRQLIKGFEKGENGKMNVILQASEHLPPIIQVSRTKAPEFKVWFTPI